jgi:hypothetical protein
MAWSYNPFTKKLDAIRSLASLVGTFLKLDTSNDPLTGNLEISKADPELRLTDTGDSEYSRWIRSDTDKKATLLNRVTKPGSSVVATGGTITNVGLERIHTFTSNGTFAVTGDPVNCKVLVVAGGGGGGGGNAGGGGGGAGGLVYNVSYSASGNITVTIGGGGTGGVADNYGINGNNSVFGDITAVGGGGGGHTATAGKSGGSGGGGGSQTATAGSATQGDSGGGIGYGNAGGANTDGGYGGAGGGGAGIAGVNNSGTNGGAGGDGKSYNINGTPTYYAGGGAGGGGNGGLGATGGLGGGGNSTQNEAGSPGTTNTGGGGGGGSDNNVAGGAGGSGIVIVSYILAISSSVEEATIISSQNGTGELEKGIHTFGDSDGRTVIDGKTVRFNIDSVEKMQLDASGKFSLNLNQLLSVAIENVDSLPAAGTKGRVVYLTSDDHLYLDQGA